VHVFRLGEWDLNSFSDYWFRVPTGTMRYVHIYR
jgi:hypothetical protein